MKFPLSLLLAVVLVGPAVALLPASDGRAVFENNCAACHGPDGRAQTPQGRKLKAHDLRLSKLSAAEIEQQIREGKKNAAGVQVMPAFVKDLTSEEITAVTAVVMAFRVPPAAGK